MFNSTLGGWPKICHVGICVEDGSEDPIIIDFIDDAGGELRRSRLSEFSESACTSKIYVGNSVHHAIMENGALRAEKYHASYCNGDKEWFNNYDLYANNCSDFVNKCVILSGYKFSEVQSLNKQINHSAPMLNVFMSVDPENAADGYRTIRLRAPGVLMPVESGNTDEGSL